MVLSTLANRGVALVAQAILGYLLTRADFGVFAIATSAATLVQSFRDGGLRLILIQRGPAHYERLSGPIFWMSLTCNTLAGAVLAIGGPVLAALYSDHRLMWILFVAAILLPAGTPLLISESRLRIDLRFGVLSKVVLLSSLGRYGVTIGSAALGAGPLSMAYGAAAATLVETAACYQAAPDQPWRRSPVFSSWMGLLAEGKWAILQIFGAGLVFWGAYVPMGLFVPKEVVGVYFFAFSIISISGYLIVTNVEAVLLPSVARLSAFPERRQQAMLRSVRGLVLTCTPLSLLVGVAYASLQRLVWPGGQWDASVIPLQIMAFTYPLFILHAIPRTVLTASGHFRQAATLMVLVGLGLMICAALGAWLGHTPAAIAAYIGFVAAAAGTLVSCAVLKGYGISYAKTIGAIFPIWGALSAVALLVILLDTFEWNGLPLTVRGALAFAVTGSCFLLLARLSFADAVSDVLTVLPPKLARAARVFFAPGRG
jgi:O-antigen/teichoic acid export membrane protein